MIEIKKPVEKPIVIIRSATGNELTNYEKRKLANIEDNAQENRIEAIKVNGQKLPIDPENKEVSLNLGKIAFKSAITPEDMTSEELFLIKCELDVE